MSNIEIKYGDRTLQLSKSADLVAIRPSTRLRGDVERAVTRLGAKHTNQKLAGFDVVNAQGAPRSMEETLDALRKESAVDVGTHVYHTSNDGVPFVPTGQLYIVFSDNAPIDDCQALIEGSHLEILETRGPREIVARITPGSPNPIKVASALQRSDLVAIAEPELATPGELTAFALPVDDLLTSQWHLQNAGVLGNSSMGLKKGADARVVAAWQTGQSLGSKSAIVAVIDDGFDLSHPDFAGVGKVVAPWDFTRNNNSPLPEFNRNYPAFDIESEEWVGDWHGTACAGVAVGAANGNGIVGAAPDCRLMPVRWGLNLSDRNIEKWFNYVTAQGAWIVSCSWGAAASYFPLSTRQRKAIENCAHNGRNGLGCVICFAAGNENHDIDDPPNSLNGFAIHPDVIAVAASTSQDKRSHYSNYGEKISVCAPSSGAGGRGILTADVTGTFTRGAQTIDSGYDAGDFTSTFGGTSSATPLVAGICALILSLRPTLTAREVKAIIEKTARQIGPASSYDAKNHSKQFGYGCINAEAAVREALGLPAPGAWTHKLASDEPWYNHPAQMAPPNGTIPAGTACVILSSAGSYTRIEAATGVVGYVATSSLQPL